VLRAGDEHVVDSGLDGTPAEDLAQLVVVDRHRLGHKRRPLSLEKILGQCTLEGRESTRVGAPKHALVAFGADKLTVGVLQAGVVADLLGEVGRRATQADSLRVLEDQLFIDQ